jgi:hypothetical protein
MTLTKKLADWYLTPSDGVFYELEQQRREWEVAAIQPMGEECPAEIKAAFGRMVAISLELELSVGAFISALLEKEDNIPVEAKRGLVLNCHDEEKHKAAFDSLALALPFSEEERQMAINYRKQIIHSKEHPLAKARDLETVLFIPLQAAMRILSFQYGNQQIERTLNDISRDEFRHITYNWEISEHLGIGINKEFNDFIVGITEWVFEPIKQHALDCTYWTERAKDMQRDGYSEELTRMTSVGIHKAPFEISNSYY